ncbi:MAG: hypothetical protein MZW92_11735 [Comamonadaceae bacterium]|nr:hypothetical protein [Comamonadaceae bacterium]
MIPSVAYTDPEVAWVGLTEDEAKAQGVKVEKGLFPWAASRPRASPTAATRASPSCCSTRQTHRVVGGGIVGTHAGDLIGEVALAIEMGADAVDIGKTIHPHPTLGEIDRHGGRGGRGRLHRPAAAAQEVTDSRTATQRVLERKGRDSSFTPHATEVSHEDGSCTGSGIAGRRPGAFAADAQHLIERSIQALGGAEALSGLKRATVSGVARFWEPEQSHAPSGECASAPSPASPSRATRLPASRVATGRGTTNTRPAAPTPLAKWSRRMRVTSTASTPPPAPSRARRTTRRSMRCPGVRLAGCASANWRAAAPTPAAGHEGRPEGARHAAPDQTVDGIRHKALRYQLDATSASSLLLDPDTRLPARIRTHRRRRRSTATRPTTWCSATGARSPARSSPTARTIVLNGHDRGADPHHRGRAEPGDRRGGLRHPGGDPGERRASRPSGRALPVGAAAPASGRVSRLRRHRLRQPAPANGLKLADDRPGHQPDPGRHATTR